MKKNHWLQQQLFCKKASSVLKWSFVLRIKFSVDTQFYAPNPAQTQSPKILVEINK